MPLTAVLDVDGTLVDTNYHHAVAVMVGDTPFDCEAARRAGVEPIAALPGGFSEHELCDAGALAAFESIDELRRRLDETPLR